MVTGQDHASCSFLGLGEVDDGPQLAPQSLRFDFDEEPLFCLARKFYLGRGAPCQHAVHCDRQLRDWRRDGLLRELFHADQDRQANSAFGQRAQMVITGRPDGSSVTSKAARLSVDPGLRT